MIKLDSSQDHKYDSVDIKQCDTSKEENTQTTSSSQLMQ